MISTTNARAALLTTVTMLASTPSFAQSGTTIDEIVVTARRVEERLQDVPISITVLSQEDLSRNNVVSARDLTIYTPSISANVRNGNTATYTIRGFTQESRSTPTVGVYFADVVAPRGGGIQPGGDGVGPGAFFDLQNVQVLNGPQGTLFGRNTTGGAVLLVPKRPTSFFDGYVEASAGNYDLRRLQGVVNIPVNDKLRVRLGVDAMQRDGYLKNRSVFGPKDFGDVDYTAVRASAVWDITPEIENYTILHGAQSRTNGVIASPKTCNPAAVSSGSPIGTFACTQLARLKSSGDFWTVENTLPRAHDDSDTWSLINTTTWAPLDNLTVKNIISYSEYKNDKIEDLYGAYWVLDGLTAAQVTRPDQVATFVPIITRPGRDLNNQSTFTEELQFQGKVFAERLSWQAGLYYEKSEPEGATGTENTSFLPCLDPSNFVCTPKIGTSGTISHLFANNTFENKAVYAQGSYSLTDQIGLTAGVRYTWDEMSSEFQAETFNFTAPNTFVGSCLNPSANPAGVAYRTNILTFAPGYDAACIQNKSHKSDDPTWLLGVDYKPLDNVMLYGKYARGYRQGGVSPFAGDGAYFYGPESVDNYEIGAKTNWGNLVRGSLNVAVFYNDLTDQQLTVQLTAPGNNPSAAIALANIGKSRISGFEVEGSISPLAGLNLTANYAKLSSEIKTITRFTPPPPYTTVAGLAPVGADLLFAIPEKYSFGVSYTLPFPEQVGKVTFGGTVVHQSTFTAFYTRNGKLPGYEIGNVNLSWEGIGGSNVDAQLFVTNVTDEEYYTHVNDQDNFTVAPATGSRGFLSYYLGEPRMFGARLKYRFGS